MNITYLKRWNDKPRCTNRRPVKMDDKDDQLALFNCPYLGWMLLESSDGRPFQEQKTKWRHNRPISKSTNSFAFTNISCIAASNHFQCSLTPWLKRPLFNESTDTTTVKWKVTMSMKWNCNRPIRCTASHFVQSPQISSNWCNSCDISGGFSKTIHSLKSLDTSSSLEKGSNLFNWLRNVTRALAGAANRRCRRLNQRAISPLPLLVTTLPISIISHNSHQLKQQSHQFLSFKCNRRVIERRLCLFFLI